MIYLIDYHLQYLALMMAALFLYCFIDVKKNYGRTAALFFFYTGCSALYVWIHSKNRYVMVDPYNQMALRYFAADSFGKSLILILGITQLLKNRTTFFKYFRGVCVAFVVFNALMILGQFANHRCVVGNSCTGFVGNPSITVGLMVALLPLFIDSWKEDWWLMIPIVAAVFVSRSSIGIGMLAAYACLYLFPWKLNLKTILKQSAIAVSGVVALFSAAYMYLGWELFFTSSRLSVWSYMMARWRKPDNIPFGTGLGTYHVFSINLQHYGNIEAQSYWNTLHQDWLQIIFETGLVGGILALAVYLVALGKVLVKKEYGVAMSVVLYGLYMAMNPAMHFPYPILFGACLFLYCLRRESLQYGTINA